MSQPEMSFSEIAKVLGISAGRCSQLYNSGMRKLSRDPEAWRLVSQLAALRQRLRNQEQCHVRPSEFYEKGIPRS